jgi:hypothetical protein
MNVSRKWWVLIVLCAVFAQRPPHASGAESLIKIAHVSGSVLDDFAGWKGFLGRGNRCFPNLHRALSAGVRAGRPTDADNATIKASDSLRKPCAPSPDGLSRISGATGRLAGTQPPGNGSGWDKFIVNFPKDDPGASFFFEISGGRDRCSAIAAYNEKGVLEQMPMVGPGDAPGSGVSVISLQEFRRRSASAQAGAWLDSVLPANDHIGVLLVRGNESPAGEQSDKVIIRIQHRPSQDSGPLFNKESIVISWSPPETSAPSPGRKHSIWPWGD